MALLCSPRYKLLIQELLRNTDDKHPDFDSLNKVGSVLHAACRAHRWASIHFRPTQALAEVSKVAMHINEAVKMQQNRQAIMMIQEKFSNKVDLVSPSRRFVRQGTYSACLGWLCLTLCVFAGPLIKKCRSDDRKYEFFLFNDLLLYATKVCILASAIRITIQPACRMLHSHRFWACRACPSSS